LFTILARLEVDACLCLHVCCKYTRSAYVIGVNNYIHHNYAIGINTLRKRLAELAWRGI